MVQLLTMVPDAHPVTLSPIDVAFGAMAFKAVSSPEPCYPSNLTATALSPVPQKNGVFQEPKGAEPISNL